MKTPRQRRHEADWHVIEVDKSLDARKKGYWKPEQGSVTTPKKSRIAGKKVKHDG